MCAVSSRRRSQTSKSLNSTGKTGKNTPQRLPIIRATSKFDVTLLRWQCDYGFRKRASIFFGFVLLWVEVNSLSSILPREEHHGHRRSGLCHRYHWRDLDEKLDEFDARPQRTTRAQDDRPRAGESGAQSVRPRGVAGVVGVGDRDLRAAVFKLVFSGFIPSSFLPRNAREDEGLRGGYSSTVNPEQR